MPLDLIHIAAYENELLAYATKELLAIEGLKIYGTQNKTSVISFNIDGIHAYDLGTIIDKLRNCHKNRTTLCTTRYGFLWYFGNCKSALLLFTTPKKK